MRHLVLPLVVAFSVIAPAGQTPDPMDVDRLGPQVGEVVPDFSAVDQHGRTRTLESIRGPKGAMIVFNRSADW